MPVIAILQASDVTDDVAGTRRRTPGGGGGVVPGRVAGYTHDGAAYCPGCAESVEVACVGDGETYTLDHFPAHGHDPSGFGVGVVSGTGEWDYPGAACDVCHTTLDTNILVYDEGGAHPHPVVEVASDAHDDTGQAAVLGDPDASGDILPVVWLTDFGPHVSVGDIDEVDRDNIIDGMEA